MRGWHLLAPLLALGILGGCSGEGSDGERQLGGPSSSASPTPREPMDDEERRVSRRLARELEGQGLTLLYVDCPPWTGAVVPSVVACQAYIDGVVGEVEVTLSRGEDGGVEFEAALGEGVLATSRLVERLQKEGYTAVDCGPTPAYPARAGMRIVCSGERSGSLQYLVATVADRSGAVKIRPD